MAMNRLARSTWRQQPSGALHRSAQQGSEGLGLTRD